MLDFTVRFCVLWSVVGHLTGFPSQRINPDTKALSTTQNSALSWANSAPHADVEYGDEYSDTEEEDDSTFELPQEVNDEIFKEIKPVLVPVPDLETQRLDKGFNNGTDDRFASFTTFISHWNISDHSVNEKPATVKQPVPEINAHSSTELAKAGITSAPSITSTHVENVSEQKQSATTGLVEATGARSPPQNSTTHTPPQNSTTHSPHTTHAQTHTPRRSTAYTYTPSSFLISVAIYVLTNYAKIDLLK